MRMRTLLFVVALVFGVVAIGLLAGPTPSQAVPAPAHAAPAVAG